MYLSLPDPASQTTSSPLSFTLSTAPQRRPGCRGAATRASASPSYLERRAAESPSALIVQHRAAARVSTSARARASLRGVGVCARRRDRPSRALRAALSRRCRVSLPLRRSASRALRGSAGAAAPGGGGQRSRGLPPSRTRGHCLAMRRVHLPSMGAAPGLHIGCVRPPLPRNAATA